MLGLGKDYIDSSKGANDSDLNVGSVAQTVDTSIGVATESYPADDPMRAVSENATKQLTERRARHVRIAKLSRDVTIECKSIRMFMLDSPLSKNSAEKTVTEAKKRILKLIKGPMKSIGLLNECCMGAWHAKTNTDGFQEYVKARIILSLMAENRIITYPEVQQELEYTIIDNGNQRPLVTMIPKSDYILGLGELSLELMRKAINNISNGDTECFETSDDFRQLYFGYLGKAGEGHLDLPVARANLNQMELALSGMRKRYGVMGPYWLEGAWRMVDILEYRKKNGL